MSAGREAMEEAARLEAAAVYSQACGDSSSAVRNHLRAVDEWNVAASNRRTAGASEQRRRPRSSTGSALGRKVEQALARGYAATEVMEMYGVTYRSIHEARRRMGGAA